MLGEMTLLAFRNTLYIRQKLPDQLDIGDKYAFLLKIKRTAHIAVLSGTAPNKELFKAPRLISGT